jgi:hypothetical protein
MNDVECVLPPVIVDVVTFESLERICVSYESQMIFCDGPGLRVPCSDEGKRYSQLVTPLRKGR